jgi:hypothetical protein
MNKLPEPFLNAIYNDRNLAIISVALMCGCKSPSKMGGASAVSDLRQSRRLEIALETDLKRICMRQGQITLSKPPRYRQAASLNPTTARNDCMTSN